MANDKAPRWRRHLAPFAWLAGLSAVGLALVGSSYALRTMDSWSSDAALTFGSALLLAGPLVLATRTVESWEIRLPRRDQEIGGHPEVASWESESLTARERLRVRWPALLCGAPLAIGGLLLMIGGNEDLGGPLAIPGPAVGAFGMGLVTAPLLFDWIGRQTERNYRRVVSRGTTTRR